MSPAGSIRRCGDSVTGFDDTCLVAEFVREPIADEHLDMRRHSLSVRSPLRRQRHLLRLRESLWVLVIHLTSPCAPKPGGYIRLKRCSEVLPCGEPRARRWDAPGAQGTRPGTQHKRVTPRHMTTVPSSLPFSSGIKVTPPAKPRPCVTVRFSVVGATSRTIAFPAVHVQFARLTVHRSDVV
jgi:hypothetical protein